MKQIPTAKEFLNSKPGVFSDPTADWMIEFAKLHVEAALKAAGNATLLYDFKEDIINSYPLSNIK